MKDFKPLTEKEQATITQAQEALELIPSISCTNCQYCVKECPKTINIPDIFNAMNKLLVYNDAASAKGTYNFISNNGNNASACISCKRCEAVCPQFIKISDELKRVAETIIL